MSKAIKIKNLFERAGRSCVDGSYKLYHNGTLYVLSAVACEVQGAKYRQIGSNY